MRYSQIERWLRKYEQTLKVAGLIIAAVFTLIEYFGHLKENRVQETLAMNQEFSSEPMVAARRDAIMEVEAWQRTLGATPMPQTPAERDASRKKWRDFVVSRVTSDRKLVAQIDTEFRFLDAVETCIENDICDEKSAHDLFGPSARELTENYCAYIAYMRQDRNRKNVSYAVKANQLAGNACHAEVFELMPPAP